MSYKVSTDTCCDLSPEMYKELDLVVCPLSVLYKGELCSEYTEQWLKDFYDGLHIRRESVGNYFPGVGKELVLPQREFLLLYKLVASPGRIFTRRQILDDNWNQSDVDPHTLEVHISRLRERFKENPDFEIVTVRGLGYKVVQKNG